MYIQIIVQSVEVNESGKLALLPGGNYSLAMRWVVLQYHKIYLRA